MSSQIIETHAKIALEEIVNQLGSGWLTLSEKHKDAAIRATRRMVELEFEKRTTGKDVDADLAFVKVTVDDFKLAGELDLYDAYWRGVNKALEALGSFLVGAGKSLIPGIGPLLKGIDIGGLINDN